MTNSAAARRTPEPRVAVLDGIRGIAVLMVMFSHYPLLTPPSHFAGLITHVSQVGELGVDLFFVLSGFLITGILMDARGGSHALRNFYVRRALRIFPLYYGVLAASYILLPLLRLVPATPWATQAWFWFYLQNVGFTFTHLSGPNHFWSLAVEEHFYFVWPFIVLHSSNRALVRWLGGSVGLTLVARLVLLAGGFGTFYFTLCRLDGLAMGGFIAVLARSGQTWTSARRWAVRGLLFLTPGLVWLAVAFTGEGNAFVQVVKNSMVGAWFAAVLVIVQTNPARSVVTRLLSTRALCAIGVYSYAMYVFHPFLFHPLASRLTEVPLVLQWVIALAATYAIAQLSWHLLEKRFMALKERFTYASTGPRPEMHATARLAAQPMAGAR